MPLNVVSNRKSKRWLDFYVLMPIGKKNLVFSLFILKKITIYDQS